MTSVPESCSRCSARQAAASPPCCASCPASSARPSGDVLFDGERVDHLPPNRRGVGIVFQNYALFPHMTVRQNVAYGLEAHHWPRERIAPRVAEMLDLVHMGAFAERLPRQLSGGQQQRVALARCLAVDPKILMLDEPFGALDKNLRLDMQIEVKRLQREYGITTILVTHDQEEALSMADRIAVMNRGRIEQVASPTEIYDQPRNAVCEPVRRHDQSVGRRESSRLTRGTECRGCRWGAASCALPSFRRGQGCACRCVRSNCALQSGRRSGQLAGTVKIVMPLGPQVIYDVEMPGGAAVKISQSRETAASDTLRRQHHSFRAGLARVRAMSFRQMSQR